MIGPRQVQEALKLALSLTIFYWIALAMNWDMPKYGALAIVLVSLGTVGASLQKSALRLVGTTVGLAVGMVCLALFAQDRWLTMLFLATHLVVVGYFMPVSRFGYAWYVAGFLPPLIWSTTYGDVENAFHYAIFRYLETSVGIVVYTLVCTFLWPRHSGKALERQARGVCDALHELFGLCRGDLADGGRAEDAKVRRQLAGAIPQMLATLRTARTDTAAVRERKRAWEELAGDVRTAGDALVLWRETIDDVRGLQPDDRLPHLADDLDVLERRLARVVDLWSVPASGVHTARPADADESLLVPLTTRADRAAVAGLSHFDRAALLGFLQQIDVLDGASRGILRTMRELAGLDAIESREEPARSADLGGPWRADPVRIVNALFPAICFVAAYVFWIGVDPPTGPSVPNMAATFALAILLTPQSALSLMAVLLGVVWVFVAPVYFFVMPRLDSGLGLLVLIFAYSFIFGLIGARKPAIKTVSLILFVMMTGISNTQVYSFIGLVDGALMFLLALAIIAVVQMLMGPGRPEQVLVRSVRRFCRGAALMTGAFAQAGPDSVARRQALRSGFFKSMIQPVPAHLEAIEGKIDAEVFVDGDRASMRQLVEALQSMVSRLRAVDLASARVARHDVEWSEPLDRVGRRLREGVERCFEQWARLEPADVLDDRAALRECARDLEKALDAQATAGPKQIDDQTLVDLYALLGGVRGLVHALAETREAVGRIDWERCAEARF